MSGVFSAPVLSASSYTGQIDFFELATDGTQALDLLGFSLGQPTELGDAQEEQLIVFLKRFTGSPTSGSGGTTATFRPLVGTATAVATLETGNTTQCTGGTSVTLWERTWNLRTEFIFDPKDFAVPRLGLSSKFVCGLAAAPNDSIGGVYGEIVIEELL